jgi:hypothetical protein
MRLRRSPRSRREDNIRIFLKEIGCEDVDWIYIAQNRHHWWAFENTAMNFLVS